MLAAYTPGTEVLSDSFRSSGRVQFMVPGAHAYLNSRLYAA